MSEIITAQDLQDAAALSRRCHAANEPLYVTRDGHTDLVVMSLACYEHLLIMNEVNAKLATAEGEIRHGLGRPLAAFLQQRLPGQPAFDVRLTAAAEADCREVHTYLERVLHAPQDVRSFDGDLADALQLLQTNPTRLPLSREPELRTRGYRRLPLGSDLGLCWVDEAAGTVWLARIFHGSQNYADYL